MPTTAERTIGETRLSRDEGIEPSSGVPLPSAPQPEEMKEQEEARTPGDVEEAQPREAPGPPYTTFSHWHKALIITLVSFLAIISPFSSSIYLPALTAIADDMNVSISLINLTVTSYLIFQAISPSFIGNFSDTYGRRPAYMICCVIYLSANIGLALQDNYAALFVLRCLQSCGSSATIALGSATAADMVTRAERGKYLGYASIGVTLGPALGPVIGGLLNEYLGWRSIFWFLTILSGVLFLVVLAFLPETCRNVVGDGSITPPLWNMSLLGYLKQRKQEHTGAETEKTKRRPNPFASLKILAERQTGLVLLFSSLMYGGYYLVMVTLSTQLTSRFGFSSVTVGLCYLPLGCGSLCYRYTGGFLMDWNFRRYAKKEGVEIVKNRQQNLNLLPIERMRVEISLPLVYLSCAMIMIYGWLLEKKYPLAGIEVSLFFVGLLFSGSLNNLNTLIVDLNVESAATAVAANNLARCLLGAGAAAIANPLIDRIGLGWASVFVAGVLIIATPILWAVMLRGQRWRMAKGRSTQGD